MNPLGMPKALSPTVINQWGLLLSWTKHNLASWQVWNDSKRFPRNPLTNGSISSQVVYTVPRTMMQATAQKWGGGSTEPLNNLFVTCWTRAFFDCSIQAVIYFSVLRWFHSLSQTHLVMGLLVLWPAPKHDLVATHHTTAGQTKK